MKIINNKRGDKILSLYWFLILILVAGGVFGMVYVFYQTPYDIREIEASMLINKIADCVSYSGKMNPVVLSSWNSNLSEQAFLSQCHLVFDSSESEEEQYYTEIAIYNLQNILVTSVSEGNNKWLSGCAIQEKKEVERLATCVKKSFYSVDDAHNQYIVKILGVVRKSEKNVKM